MFVAQSSAPKSTGPSVKGAATSSTTTITLPTHAVGDLIILCAVIDSSTQPTVPASGGTVPTWTTLDTGSATRATVKTVYCVATASNHTSGTWTSVTGLTATVVTGQNASTPIGGHATGQNTATGTISTFPAITQTNTTGSSVIVHMGICPPVSASASNWPALPTGYTQRAAANTTGSTSAAIVFSKDITTSDGQVSLTKSGAMRTGSATVEVLA